MEGMRKRIVAMFRWIRAFSIKRFLKAYVDAAMKEDLDAAHREIAELRAYRRGVLDARSRIIIKNYTGKG